MGAPSSCWPILFTVVFITAHFGTAGAAQTFTDEAGELIYAIDENGMVSMFENSPGTDVTLSVTRGTREQMQPVVTEVQPPAVPAGSFTVLKLRGRNLVGARVKLSVPAIEVKPFAGKPKELAIPIQVPLDLPPGEVTVEVTTPIGRTTARFTTTEVRIGTDEGAKRDDVIKHAGQGYGGDEGVRTLPTTAPHTCPPGMVGVASEGGGFCIEVDRTFSGDFRKADRVCALNGKRLCMVSEWQAACEQAGTGKVPLKNMKGDWEWTAGFDILHDDTQQDTRYFLMGKSDCATQHGTMRIHAEQFVGRCCKNP
ncbi:MAG: hypothetical protein EPO02_12570 [Nitrospirae bacterium]|nr:MAG: hypothetical protein EPO02_12570 [Nitrospirota bacterium]